MAFTTGSDRIPITGLEDVEFVVGVEGNDDEKLPIAHTCFNQIILPLYTTKDKLREKLTLAVENSEGFGMVWYVNFKIIFKKIKVFTYYLIIL